MKAMSEKTKQTITQAFYLDAMCAQEHQRVKDSYEHFFWVEYLWSVTVSGMFTLSIVYGEDPKQTPIPPPRRELQMSPKAHLLAYSNSDNDEFANSDPLRTIDLASDPVFGTFQSLPFLPAGLLYSTRAGEVPTFSLLAMTPAMTINYEYSGFFEYQELEKLWDAIWKLVGTVRKAYADEQIEAEFQKWNLP